MAVDDVYRCDYFMNLDGKDVSVAIHWLISEGLEGTPLAVAKAIAETTTDAFWTTFWRGYASPQLIFNYTKCQKVDPERDVIYISRLITNSPGTGTGDSLNGTDAVLVAEYTNAWGPRTRGRIYLPGLPETEATLGRLHQTPYDNIQDSADVLFVESLTVEGPPAGELTSVTFSPAKYVDDVLVLPSIYSGPIRPVVRPRIATQRRRRTSVDLPSEDP